MSVRYLAPAAPDCELQIGVALDRVTTSSVRVHYDAVAAGIPVAEGTARYVCINVATGRPTPLPAAIIF